MSAISSSTLGGSNRLYSSVVRQLADYLLVPSFYDRTVRS